MSIPEKLINFKCYDDGDDIVGTSDVVLPGLNYMTESITGAGIAGDIDSPVLGHFQSLTTTINWRTLVDENITFIAPKTYHFDFRGSVQIYDEDSGDTSTKALKVVMRARPKGLTLGNLDVGNKMGTSGEFELVYLKISVDGKEYVEIDKLSFICRIDGVDYLEKVRQDLGLS